MVWFEKNGRLHTQRYESRPSYSASYLCPHAVAASLKRGTLEAYFKWLVANKRKTGGLNYSKAITFGMPAGRGRKGERQPRSRRSKQTTRMVVPRNPLPSTPSIGTNGSENNPDGTQLQSELYTASFQPSVDLHQAQLSTLYPAVYNPPGFPFHGGLFDHSFAHTHRKSVSKRHPSIGPCLFHHRQQQEPGTRDCRHIRITSWPSQKI